MHRRMILHLFLILCFWANHYVPAHYLPNTSTTCRRIMRAFAHATCQCTMRAFARTMPAMGHALRARRGSMTSTQWLQTKHYQLE